MATLRVTFLSSLILELVATISVALVAVAIGLRLMDGSLDLRTALFALVLAPEAYLPLRQLGANYHASAEGMAAAEQVFAVLEAPRARPRRRAPTSRDPALASGLDRRGADASATPAAPGRRSTDVSLTVEPGRGAGARRAERVRQVDAARACCSGSSRPSAGRCGSETSTLAELDLDGLARAAGVGAAAAASVRGSIAENVRLGRADASTDARSGRRSTRPA